MSLSLVQTQAIAALARELYDYLPGSSRWGTYTFATAAAQHGIGEFWAGGSKLPALTQLLEVTLDRRSSAFCPLIETIVREGLKYRQRRGTPMSRTDLDRLNGLVKAVGFKIPGLWDPSFAASLPEAPLSPAASSPASEGQDANGAATRAQRRRETLVGLRDRFMELHALPDRQAAGRGLERVLTDLFAEFELSPRGSFVIAGEQMDGSIVLDGASYLVEAKWEKGGIEAAPLYVFREKVAGKSSVTRGIFVSIDGYTVNARTAITQGKQPNFLMLDGYHLFAALNGQEDLPALLRALLRELADTGRPHVTLPELAGRR